MVDTSNCTNKKYVRGIITSLINSHKVYLYYKVPNHQVQYLMPIIFFNDEVVRILYPHDDALALHNVARTIFSIATYEYQVSKNAPMRDPTDGICGQDGYA